MAPSEAAAANDLPAFRKPSIATGRAFPQPGCAMAGCPLAINSTSMPPSDRRLEIWQVHLRLQPSPLVFPLSYTLADTLSAAAFWTRSATVFHIGQIPTTPSCALSAVTPFPSYTPSQHRQRQLGQSQTAIFAAHTAHTAPRFLAASLVHQTSYIYRLEQIPVSPRLLSRIYPGQPRQQRIKRHLVQFQRRPLTAILPASNRKPASITFQVRLPAPSNVCVN